MRWPFSFFGRSAPANGSQAHEAASPRREWALLPAIQRTVGETHLTAPAAAFVGSLAGTHDPGLSLEPLGHHVSLDGPSGLVTGLARVETYAHAAELVDRPRSRREPTVQRRFLAGESADVPSPDEAHSEPDPASEPVRTSYAVDDEPGNVRPPLTRLADSDASALQLVSQPRSAAAVTEAPIRGEASSTAVTESPARPLAAQRLTLGQSRRLGLGAPLSHEPATAVQRSLEPPSLDLAPPVRSVRGDHVDAGSLPEPLGAETEAAEAVMSPVERIAPIVGATIQRTATPDGGADQATAEPAPGRPAPDSEVEPASALDSPFVQRVVAAPLPAMYPRPVVMPTAPIASDRRPLPSIRRTMESLEPAGESPEPPVFQRMPAVATSGPLTLLPKADVRDAAASPRHLDVAPIPARSLLTLPPRAALAPAVQRGGTEPDDLVAFSPFASKPTSRTVESAASGPEIPAVQRAVAAGESESEPGAGPAAASAAGGAAAMPAQSDKDLDELARKLHDRISLHLRRDLLIQRERAGMVTDLR